MNCEDAQLMICARLDGELSPGDAADLGEHLSGCPGCRAVADAVALQDGELRSAFAPRRRAARRLAERVATHAGPRAGRAPGRLLGVSATLLTTAAALLLGLFTITRERVYPPRTPAPVALNAAPARVPRLVPADAPKVLALPVAAVGTTLSAAPGRPAAFALADGSRLFLNGDSRVQVLPESLKLERGEVYAEAAGPLVLDAPGRRVTARAAHLVARVANASTTVSVTRGRADVDGKPVDAGRGQAARLLDWTRGLVPETPLVPAGEYGGGALVAVDPYGDKARLALRKYHVDVHVEDGFARTTIDQTYFNESESDLEGTFFFPLPSDASLSQLAMYVDGQQMPGGMAERDHARQTYESIRWSRRDPALLEWIDGTLFQMRVFPLEARREKRVFLSYTQKLPVGGSRATYRFPAGHSAGAAREWSFAARVRGAAGLSVASPSHPEAVSRAEGGDLILSASAKNAIPDRDIVLTIDDAAGPATSFRKARHDGHEYLMLRHRPDLSKSAAPRAARRDWVFLVETHGGRDPLLARAQIELMRAMLGRAEPGDTFAVAAVGTAARRWQPGRVPVTEDSVSQAAAWLGGAHLVGACDVEAGLSAAGDLLSGAADPCLVHLGSGVASLGVTEPGELARLVPAGVPFVGVAVGKRFSAGFLKSAAGRSGGLFAQVNPDEPLAWRALEIVSTLNAPRLLNVTVAAECPVGTTPPTVLPLSDAIADGEELAAVTRYRVSGVMPTAFVVTGTLEGRTVTERVPVPPAPPQGEYLPRTWARLEIDRMLAESAEGNKAAIVALSKAMYVMSPFTSLLVLESEAMYRQFNVDRGRKDHWALYGAPQRVPVVFEPTPAMAASGRGTGPAGQKPHENAVRATLPQRGLPEVLRGPPVLVERATLLSLADEVHDARDLDGDVLAQDTMAVEDSPRGFETFNKSSSAGRLGDRAGLPAKSDTRSDWALGVRLQVEGGRSAGRRGALPALRLAQGVNGAFGRDRFAQKEAFFMDSPALPYPLVLNRPAPGKPPLPSADAPAYLTRVQWNDDARYFRDLLAHAPGMQNSVADVATVLDAEAAPRLARRVGTVSPAARALLDKARTAGWRRLRLPGDAPDTVRLFDGRGRFRVERTLPSGLRELRVRDDAGDRTLYPELGLGAARAVSRFHRAEWAAGVPDALPPADDLAFGADVSADGTTVCVTPHALEGRASVASEVYAFAPDGRLVERRRETAGKTVWSLAFDPDGTIRSGDAVTRRTLEACAAPDLSPDTSALVMVPLPWRSHDHVYRELGLNPNESLYDGENQCCHYLTPEERIRLLFTEVARDKGDHARYLWLNHVHLAGDTRVGWQVLLHASGGGVESPLCWRRAAEAGPHRRLWLYLAESGEDDLARANARLGLPPLEPSPGEAFVDRLRLFRELSARWSSEHKGDAFTGVRAAEWEWAVQFAEAKPDADDSWAVLMLATLTPGEGRPHARLAAAWATLAEHQPDARRYGAAYERAVQLGLSGDHDAQRRALEAMTRNAIEAGRVAPMDDQIRNAFATQNGERSDFPAHLRSLAKVAIDAGRRPLAVTLAWQAHQLGDPAVADALLADALNGVAPGEPRDRAYRAAVDFRRTAGRPDAAAKLLADWLTDPEAAKRPHLWREAATLAGERDRQPERAAFLERAIDLEFADLPEAVDLDAVRTDFRTLTGHYLWLAKASKALARPLDAGFPGRVVLAADRWRRLDADSDEPARTASDILRLVGTPEADALAWDYATTPLVRATVGASAYLELARTLAAEGSIDLADAAYVAAFRAEATNAQTLWDRAEMLTRTGQTARAKAVYAQIARTKWQPRFEWMAQEAKRRM